ncbi:MAG: DUF2147 domain-containing protein [Alphaproteobacteria bacterium]|nr:DUF2147 domain-containing protein [Alphaproteobacteria bacterium]
MSRIALSSKCLAIGTALIWSASAFAADDPRGVWFDHDGRGAVEIKDCQKGAGLCGFVVHVKEKKHEDRCGTQILGNVTSNGGGWIYSPSRGKKYTVRLNQLSDDKLRVVGNASSSFFSKTFTWKRAPEDIALCGKYAAATSAAKETKTAPAVERKITRKTTRKVERDIVRRDEEFLDEKPRRAVRKELPSIAAREEAELERNAVEPEVEAEQEIRDDKELGAVVDEEAEPGEAPVENEVTEVIDKLIDKANEYTGKMKRKCKFRIPYVDKVVMIPCGD